MCSVYVDTGGRLLRGNRSQKVHSSSYQAFDSRGYPPLAQLGIDVVSSHLAVWACFTSFFTPHCYQLLGDSDHVRASFSCLSGCFDMVLLVTGTLLIVLCPQCNMMRMYC
jgi:hypothetical protein